MTVRHRNSLLTEKSQRYTKYRKRKTEVDEGYQEKDGNR